MKPLLQVLTEARALIADPTHWSQGSFAQTADGTATEPTHPAAHSFCVVGALGRVCGFESEPLRDLLVKPYLPVTNDEARLLLCAAYCLSLFLPSRPYSSARLMSYNDAGAQHGDILFLYDRAIDFLRSTEAGAA